jgi:threonine/homoserine/homoserine lactone efflux protein
VLKLAGAAYLAFLGVMAFRNARRAGGRATRARGFFLRPRWRTLMERVTGTVFIGFGVRLATLSHR